VTAKPRPTEFELIARYFAPLAAGAPGAASLADDVALITVAAGEDLVLKTDAIVAGVHFTGQEPAGLIARKLLRVNLSDLAAKGARPLG
jgi:thiamine-monophosphate kinase